MKKNFDRDLTNKMDGEKKIIIIKRFNEKRPITDNIWIPSNEDEILYAQRFQGNPDKILLLKKSAIAKVKLIKKIEEIFLSQ